MKKSSTRLYVLSILIIAFIGAALTIYSVFSSINSQKRFLQQRVAGLANAVPRDTIKQLAATNSDSGTAEYSEIKKTMQDIASVNEDIRFIYITKERDGTIYFVADSEPAGSEDESPPGQSYDEVDSLYKSIHSFNQTLVLGPTRDRWGTWITGASPIVNDGKIIAVLGMDIPASDYYRNIFVSAASVVIPTLLVIGLLSIAASRGRQREKDFESKNKLIALVSENVQIPLEGVAWATEKLKKSPVVIQDPDTNNIALELSRSVSKVSDSLKDIVNASATTGDVKKIDLVDRVDIVALMIDTIDTFKLNASTKNVSIMLGSTWPASFVVDTNAEEFNRLINGIITYSLGRTASNSSLFFTYLSDANSWSIIAFNNNLSPHDQNVTALTTVRAQQLGGDISIDPDTKGITLRFKKTGTEIVR